MVSNLELENGRSQDWPEGLHLRVRTRAKASQLKRELAVYQRWDGVREEQRFFLPVTCGKRMGFSSTG